MLIDYMRLTMFFPYKHVLWATRYTVCMHNVDDKYKAKRAFFQVSLY